MSDKALEAPGDPDLPPVHSSNWGLEPTQFCLISGPGPLHPNTLCSFPAQGVFPLTPDLLLAWPWPLLCLSLLAYPGPGALSPHILPSEWGLMESSAREMPLIS